MPRFDLKEGTFYLDPEKQAYYSWLRGIQRRNEGEPLAVATYHINGGIANQTLVFGRKDRRRAD